MVHSELQIMVLLYGSDRAHLLAMTSGLSGSDAASISRGSIVQSGRRRSAEPRCFLRRTQMTRKIFGVKIPDSKMAREVTQLIRNAEGDLLFYHSTRVYFWGALIGRRKRLTFDPELLYTAAMFHDIGLYRELSGEPASL
jgi:HD-GYP domain-containing protein (c-di-GMP phosphodiesterase class II)